MTAIYATAAGGRAVEQRYREILRLWPVPNERLTIPTREGDTFVVACGPPDAPPLLLLHGSARTPRCGWEMSPLGQDFRVYAVDLVGEPGLSAPSCPALASEAYALWLDDVLRAWPVPRVSLWASRSAGGWPSTTRSAARQG